MIVESTKVIEKEMSSCIEDENFFPPGFRFHPTDEELVLYYLKRKICRRRHKLDVIGETDVYKWDPEELPGLSKLKTGDRQWFFFSPRDRKYPNGARSNRATRQGYWKATGKDRIITCNARVVGVKKTLVYYKGRAPSGERTDWVMHEYTMDEDELKRCQFAQDYYALYKIYKKSGPGPKNGEQYGAPFIEEDWEDAGNDASSLIGRDNSVKQIEKFVTIDRDGVNSQVQSQLTDLKEFMNRIVANEAVLVPNPDVDYTYSLDNFVSEEEAALSNLVDQSSMGINLPEQNLMIQSACQQHNVQPSFDITHSGTSQLQLHEAPEVTSAPKSFVPEPRVIVEDFLEDFLEINDLIGPEPTVQNAGKPMEALEDLQFDELGGLSAFDLCKDSSLFLCEDETGGRGQSSEMNVKNLEYGVGNSVSNLYVNGFETGTTNYYQQANLCSGNRQTFQQSVYDQVCSFTPLEAHQGCVPPVNSGIFYDGNLANQHTGANQNDSQKQDDGIDSWLSSALWAFVESIPTTPASASESALVNRAFERISSFSRVRINPKNMNVAAGHTSATSKNSDKSRTRIFCFSLLGLLCAILWMVLGTSVQGLGRTYLHK